MKKTKYRVYWRTWERGVEDIVAADEDEARELLYDALGTLEPSDEGIDIEDIDEDGEIEVEDDNVGGAPEPIEKWWERLSFIVKNDGKDENDIDYDLALVKFAKFLCEQIKKGNPVLLLTAASP